MLRSFTKLTGALCVFASATVVIISAAAAADSGSEPILHVIDTDKINDDRKTASVARVGSGSDPILHVIETDNSDEGQEKVQSSGSKKKSVSKAKKQASKKRSTSKASSVKAKNYVKLIKKAATRHGVPVKIAKAVVEVESNFNPRARGRAGEVGLMQIKPATARGIGYRGSTKALYDPETNLEWGMKYLAGAHKRANGDLCGTILRYNAGHYAKRMNPISRRYCSKVKRLIASS